ncbi:MAG: YbhB/YbcL family Raf kinase inhibitor-like protein [Candidatus Pacebacteria bacterium]|nr:YbhB/YbcL family Raf kinase inhibitor-like protein [Candidatus Paceibacterota bacterium]
MNTEKSFTSALSITSPAFADDELMPFLHTCDGSNINPPLRIEHVPADTRSLVLIMDDPDAPIGVWDHWIKWNISPDINVIEEGKEPEGISGTGTAGNTNYHGPCPPSGVHRYLFKLYALDSKLDLLPGASKKEVEKAMGEHILEKAQLIGLYKRN